MRACSQRLKAKHLVELRVEQGIECMSLSWAMMALLGSRDSGGLLGTWGGGGVAGQACPEAVAWVIFSWSCRGRSAKS